MRVARTSKITRSAAAAGVNRLLLVGLAGLTVIALAVALWRRPPPVESPAAVSTAEAGQSDTTGEFAAVPVTTAAPAEIAAGSAVAKPDPKPVVAAASSPLNILSRGEPTAEARRAVTALTQFDFSGGSVTAVQAAVWKESLRALVAQGESAVPAIREFLEKNLDLGFGTLENGAALGDSSLRMALLRAMQEIGGEQAIAGSLQTLQTSADPAELALMAAYLQKADPAQYRDSILAAAHEALGMAASGKWDGRDVAPLFDVLKTFGGEAAARDLEQYANVWFNYTPLVLAELPDGAGIASLIRLNTDGSVSLGKDIYQRMLAQVSAQAPEPGNALVQLAQSGKIGDSNWRAIADALAGIRLELAQSPLSGSTPPPGATSRSYHIAIGNQNYIEQPAPADMPVEQVAQRIAVIDRLLGVTSNPSAVSYLQQARGTLSTRL